VSELAGVGPSDLLRFCRFEAETVAAVPLARGVALALSLRGGVLLPLGSTGGRRPATHIRYGHMRLHADVALRVLTQANVIPCSDRFFLGGPDSLRGFSTKGVGPSGARRPLDSSLEGEDGARTLTHDALGGDLLCSTSAAVTFDVRSCAEAPA
jgi:outer membrane protein insertion porin family